MIVVNLDGLELLDAWYEEDSTMRVRFDFPLFAARGTRSTAVVYFGLDPGCRLGTHVDSTEELLLILEGTAELTVGEEQGRASAGEIAVVPAMVPHSLRNDGEETVRVVGFFSSSTVDSIFDRPMMPINQQLVGSPPLEAEQILST